MTVWMVACPACRAELGPLEGDELACGGCAAHYRRVDGIWRFVVADRAAAIDGFLADYTAIRRAEGRGSASAEHYLRLPQTAPDDPLAWQWSMRATSWRHVRRRLIDRLPASRTVLDLGAGVGWLSHRLALLGHRPLAVDLSTDDLDGLGAARHYGGAWPVVQAEFDRLPLVDGSADLAIFNASLHYSVDYRTTLTEVRRVLRPGGRVVVVDTPVYRHDRSGRQMVAARHADFAARFGTRSDSMPSMEYLTEGMLASIAEDLDLRWERSVAWYGWRWWWRPHRARLARQREPSRFVTLVGRWDAR